MELPTYTNIWKIEKRLYKLYDFRLPMPLPVGQVAAFLAIAIPYMIVLTLVGMPFSHTWVWLYVLPPGAAAWLVTRPVLEGKRLPELVVSQVRYLTEPRTWCRLAPLAEKDSIMVIARVWRASAAAGATPAPQHVPVMVTATPAGQEAAAGANSADPATRPHAEPDSSAAVGAATGDGAALGAADARAVTDSVAEPAINDVAVTDVAITQAHSVAAADSVAEAAAAESITEDSTAAADLTVAAVTEAVDAGADRIENPSPGNLTDSASADGQIAAAPPSPTVRPVLKVRTEPGAGRPLHVLERALRSSRGGWNDRVVVVPGGHRPGSPDHAQRDQARARLPLAGPARIVILGTSTGAGQTVTTLLTGQLLASLRGEAVAVLDLGGRPGSLTELARDVPRLLPGRLASSRLAGGRATPDRLRGLQVVTADHSGPGPRDADRLIDAVVARYPITLADPAPADVPRAVQVADQLVLVTPASASSAGSLAMTLEWLEAHGHGRLAQTSVTVLNGASKQTADDVERATAVASGRCRAIVRVPWDNSLAARSQLSTATVHAFTALAGVLVSGLADPALAGSAEGGSVSR